MYQTSDKVLHSFVFLLSLKDELQVQRMPTTVASQEIGIKATTDNKNSHQDRSGGHHEEAGRVSTPINSEDHAFAFSSSYINTPPKDISLPDDFDFLTYSDSLESNLNHDHHPAWSEEGRGEINIRETDSEENIIIAKMESSDGMWTQIKMRDKKCESQEQSSFRNQAIFQLKEPRRDGMFIYNLTKITKLKILVSNLKICQKLMQVDYNYIKFIIFSCSYTH